MTPDTITREDSRSALDEFAQAPATGQAVVPLATYMPPAERHGAIKVEVTRSPALIRSAISEMASLLGERGFYRWPVKNKRKGTTEWVEGVSIKGAMALVKAYKNCRVACPVIVDLGSHWRFHAVFVDFENGIEIERSFLQRKGIAGMGDDAARREDMAYQVGQSKAERNVIINALEIEADILLEECRRSIIDRVGQNLEHYRGSIIERAAERSIDLVRIEAVVGRPAKEWLGPDIVRVIGMMSAVRDGMATLDETFPPLGGKDTVDETTGEITRDALDAFAGSTDGKALADPEASPSPPASADPAAAGAPGNDASAAVLPKVQEVVFKLLQLATDTSITSQERIDTLDMLTPTYEDALPGSGEFVRTAVQTAAKVAQGQLKVDAARTYLLDLWKA